MKSTEFSLIFPSGRSVAAVKKDAKKLAKSESIPLSRALDQLVVVNGLSPMAWSKALVLLDRRARELNCEKTMTDNNNPFADNTYKEHKFSKADMSGSKFHSVDLTGAHFWAVLKHAQFKDCNMESTVFNNINLMGSSYENINLSKSTFNDINISGATFTNLNMANVEISDANLEGMKINGVLVTELLAGYEKNK